MARNLIELIKASSRAPIFGASFKNSVVPTNNVQSMTGFRLSSYTVSSWIFNTQPFDPFDFTYSDNAVLSLQATLTRGVEAYRIQRTNTAAFSVYLQSVSGLTFGSSVALETLSTPDGGGVFNMDIRLRAPYSGTASVSITSTKVNEFTQGGIRFQDVRFQAVATGGGGGTSQFRLYIDYDPDSANFNPGLRNAQDGWLFGITNRGYQVSDLEFRWWLTQAQADANNSTAVYSTQSAFFLTIQEVMAIFEQWVYMRWRLPGEAWGPVIAHQYRDAGTQA